MSSSKRDIYCLKYDDIMGVYIRIYIYTYIYSNMQQYTRDGIICAYVYTYINRHSVIYVCVNVCHTSMYVELYLYIYIYPKSPCPTSLFSSVLPLHPDKSPEGVVAKGSIVKVTTTWEML